MQDEIKLPGKDFRGYFSDLSPVFSKSSDPVIRHWVEKEAMAADPRAAIALRLDTPNIDPEPLFIIEENQKYADDRAIMVRDAGHFAQLERPEEFNQDLSRWIQKLPQ